MASNRIFDASFIPGSQSAQLLRAQAVEEQTHSVRDHLPAVQLWERPGKKPNHGMIGISQFRLISIGPTGTPGPRTTCCFSPPARLVPTSFSGFAKSHFTAIHGSLSHLGQSQFFSGSCPNTDFFNNDSSSKMFKATVAKHDLRQSEMPFFQPLQGTSISWSWPSSACNKQLVLRKKLQNSGYKLQTSQLNH